MSAVMRLGDKTCVLLWGPLVGPRRPKISWKKERKGKKISFRASCHRLLLSLYVSILLFLPSVHLNQGRASSWWQDKIECAHQHRLPSSRVPLFDQLIRESNQAWRWKKGYMRLSKNTILSLQWFSWVLFLTFLHAFSCRVIKVAKNNTSMTIKGNYCTSVSLED